MWLVAVEVIYSQWTTVSGDYPTNITCQLEDWVASASFWKMQMLTI